MSLFLEHFLASRPGNRTLCWCFRPSRGGNGQNRAKCPRGRGGLRTRGLGTVNGSRDPL